VTHKDAQTSAMAGSAGPVLWSASDLRALEGIRVGPREVVYAFVSLVGEPSSVDEALLDDEERHRASRFVRPTDCRRFVLAHVALRLFLSRCLAVEPANLSYENGVHGKPHLARGLPPLDFNLSHSGEVGLLAAARDRSVGVDVEHVRDVPDAQSIADAHFSVAEREGLRLLPPAERQAAFFYCWTRKEAVIKAGGEGLGSALDDFDVDLAPGSVTAVKRSGDAAWLVRDLPSPPGYTAAGAVEDSSSTVRWRELGPTDAG
jgi:4'-phosphopantetheinyl transferase